VLFPCNQWLSASEADKKITRTLDAEEGDAAAAQAAPSLAPMPPAGPHVLARIVAPELRAAAGAGVGIGPGLGAPGYKLLFVTSNVCMAGTAAPVYFELVGEHGSSGESALLSGRANRGGRALLPLRMCLCYCAPVGAS
jgi:hypothetical protein